MSYSDDIVITDIVRVLHPVGKGADSFSCFTRESGISSHEIILRLCGESDSFFDSYHFHGVAGDIKYLPQGHGNIVHEARGDTGECINIFFSADAPFSDEPFKFNSVNFDEFKRLFEKAETLWLKKDTGYRYETISVLYRILALVKKEREGAVSQDPKYLKIKTAVEYLNLNFREAEIDYSYTASLCNMSCSYFRRLFCDCMGTSPARYVIGKKIEYAKDMLSTGQYSVSEISDATGFRDIYYFSHVFKKLEGISPSQFAEGAALCK